MRETRKKYLWRVGKFFKDQHGQIVQVTELYKSSRGPYVYYFEYITHYKFHSTKECYQWDKTFTILSKKESDNIKVRLL